MQQAPPHAAGYLNPQTWVNLLLTKFRSVPFYLVALLLHLLVILIFGTYEVTRAQSGGVAVFVAPTAAKPVGPVTPPPPPPAEKQEAKLADTKPKSAAAAASRPITVATPLPSTSINIPTPVAAPMMQQGLKPLKADFSKVSVPGIYRGRLTGMGRAEAIGRGGGGNVDKLEGAVLRALQWLKANQNEDGSWGGQYKSAMTGLALLTFLAHGERQDSATFGDTVLKGVQWIMEFGRKNKGKLGNEHVEYQHAIATYALAEDYALTQIGDLLTVLEDAVKLIVNSQAPNGSWDYGYNTSGHDDPKRPGGDTSISGWNIQALKAAKLAGVKVAGLDASMQKAIGFLRSVYDEKSHRFGYAVKEPRSEALVGVGILCMQFLNAGDSREVRGALNTAREFKCDWAKGNEASSYTWYYVTQAMFQAGGSYWTAWNREFRDEILKHQRADGAWPVPGTVGNTPPREGGWRQVPNPKDQPVYHTTLLCLMLEVYYRFLPTFK